jgi:transcription elongation GreA/GreB family factor
LSAVVREFASFARSHIPAKKHHPYFTRNPAMSRAFVNEELAAAQADQPVERRVSDQPNYVTPQGLLELQARVRQLQAEPLDDADPQHQAEVARDLRYFIHQASTAQVIPAVNTTGKVQIGSWVTYVDEDDVTHRVCLVGEDQADAAHGLINWGSPLGRALIGAAVGDEVLWQCPAGNRSIEIVKISLQPE